MTKHKQQNTKVVAKGPDPMLFFSATKVLNCSSSTPEQRGRQIHGLKLSPVGRMETNGENAQLEQ